MLFIISVPMIALRASTAFLSVRCVLMHTQTYEKGVCSHETCRELISSDPRTALATRGGLHFFDCTPRGSLETKHNNLITLTKTFLLTE